MRRAFLRGALAVLAGWLACGSALAAKPQLPLWEAQGPQGKLYLFGSVHVCHAGCLPLPPAALKRLAASRALVVELDPRRPDTQTKLLHAAVLPNGQQLADQLSAEDWQRVQALAGHLAVPVEYLKGFQPWMVTLVLTLTAAQRAGFDVAQGIDLSLMAEAEQRSIPVDELESIEEQIAALAAGGASAQQEAFRLALNQLEDEHVARYLGALIQRWQAGDAAGLKRLMDESVPADSAVTRALIDERNVTMADRLVTRMQDRRDRFVVVGVAHMLGPRGVPALLAKRGYRVRQISAGD